VETGYNGFFYGGRVAELWIRWPIATGNNHKKTVRRRRFRATGHQIIALTCRHKQLCDQHNRQVSYIRYHLFRSINPATGFNPSEFQWELLIPETRRRGNPSRAVLLALISSLPSLPSVKN
jgi:hypothetical protein